ncbi:hypothetical protein [Rhodococcus spongiicola]|uniref:hypothetical protein n=1 Tax=Rhodococcus spongiicola TaxID=2487352 RepID=UPI001F176DCE|nr:hypothetical protein [Rhodococcus spongiicola]
MSTTVYLSRTEVAERAGVHRDSLKESYHLPPPDAMIGDRRGWLPETIDAWMAARPGRGNWGREDPVLAEVEWVTVPAVGRIYGFSLREVETRIEETNMTVHRQKRVRVLASVDVLREFGPQPGT